MRILVTGGTGFIGSNIALQLISEGHEVLVTGHDCEQKIDGAVKYLQPSLLGIDWNALGRLDAVFHLAAINDTTNMDRDEMMLSNYKSTIELFKRAIANGCKRIIYASSTAQYGNEPAPYVEGKTKANPMNPYGESKKLVDEEVMRMIEKHPDVVFVGLRYCNVYGPRENHKGKRATMIYQLANQMIKGDVKLFKDGSQKRDYVYVKDVVRANMLALKAAKSCIVHCAYGKATTFNRLVEVLNKVLSVDRKIEYIDNPYEGRYQDYTECDMRLAKEMIGFEPEYGIEEGIQDYLESGFLIAK